MKALEALVESKTGKIYPTYKEKNRSSNVYAALDAVGILRWYSMESDKELAPVPFAETDDLNWQLYHEEKKIRPEKAGELWKSNDGRTCMIFEPEYQLKRCWSPDGFIDCYDEKMIHNKNGWTRLYPPVKEEKLLEMYWVDAERSYIAGKSRFDNGHSCKVRVKVFEEKS